GKKANRFDAYNYEATYLDRWTGEGTSNTEPRITFGGHNFLPSEYFIEDGSFLRIRNVQLSYSFKNMLANTEKIQDIMVYVSGTNLFTFTKYSGSNPEIASGSVINSGIDMSVYPVLTIYSFGLNIKF
ncbi:MAG: TonB-dependent receptor, partial [Spirochaetes bacterium]